MPGVDLPPARFRAGGRVRTLARGSRLALLFVALAGVMLRPHFGRFPSDPGDPAFVAWAMAWTGHAAVHAPTHLFDANVFWPRGGALGYSDLLLPIAPLYLVFHAFTGSWEIALALTDCALLVFALAASFCLARTITGRPESAMFAAIASSLNGFVLAQISHVQMYSLGFVALSFLLLFRLLDEPSTGRALAVAVSLAATFYAAAYFGLIVAAGAVVAVLLFALLRRRSLGVRFVRSLAVAAVVVAVLVGPGVLAYARAARAADFHRAADKTWGLDARDLVTPAPGSYLYGPLARRSILADAEHRFFPGFTTYGLAAIGGVALLLRRARHHRDRDALLLLAAGVFALVLALGPTVASHAAPFRLFHDHLPGFNAIRAVARFAVVFLLAIAVLAAVGLARVTAGLSRRAQLSWGVLACALLLAELAAPLRWEGLRHDRATLAVYHALARRGAGAVAEIPMADRSSRPIGWAVTEAPRMLFSTIDWHPRVDGYSGVTPHGYARDVAVLNTFPAPAALERLHALRVRYVVWHSRVGASTRALPVLPPGLHGRRFGEAWLITLP